MKTLVPMRRTIIWLLNWQKTEQSEVTGILSIEADRDREAGRRQRLFGEEEAQVVEGFVPELHSEEAV